MEVLWIVLFCLVVFFFQDIVKWVAKTLGKVDARIAGYGLFVLLAVAMLRIIIWTEMATWSKVSLVLVIVGWIGLITAGVLSLLFVATMPEQMERESEEKDREGA